MGRGKRQVLAAVGGRRQWAADRALRAPLRAPGRPEPSRAVQREFWRVIVSGVSRVEAAGPWVCRGRWGLGGSVTLVGCRR